MLVNTEHFRNSKAKIFRTNNGMSASKYQACYSHGKKFSLVFFPFQNGVFLIILMFIEAFLLYYIYDKVGGHRNAMSDSFLSDIINRRHYEAFDTVQSKVRHL